jgi:hypothetical protein
LSFVFVLKNSEINEIEEEIFYLRFGTGLNASSLEPSVDSLESLCDDGGVVGFLTTEVLFDD